MSKRYCIYCGKVVKTESTKSRPFSMRIAKCKNCDGWFQYDVLAPPSWEKNEPYLDFTKALVVKNRIKPAVREI